MKKAIFLVVMMLTSLGIAGCGNSDTASSPAKSGTVADTAKTDTVESSEGMNTETGALVTNLFEHAAPQNSALEMYYFDGQQVVVRTLYDSEREQEILAELNELQGQETSIESLEEWQTPCYGFSISDEDGYDLKVACDGKLWLNEHGKVYRVEVDLTKIWNSLQGEDEEADRSILTFPNAGNLGAFHKEFYKVSSAAATPDSMPLEMTMKVLSIEDGIATVEIDNHSGYEMDYGMYYSLEKEIDGTWYELPIVENNIGFEDIACILPDLQKATETCDLNIFGELEDGKYCLVKDGMRAEFELPVK